MADIQEKCSTPLKSIRAYCLGCCGNKAPEVRACPSTNCALYPFRFGHMPGQGLTDEQRQKKAEHLKAYRFASKQRHKMARDDA